MKAILFILVLLLSLQGCRSRNEFLTIEEQDKLLNIAIKIEEDSSWSIINRARHGFYYMVKQQFLDSIFLDSSKIHLIDRNINVQEIRSQYQKALKESNKLISDSFDFVHIIEFTNKTPEFLSFSKPIKYLKYYFINFSYNSWSSGYKSTLILEKSGSEQYRLIYRRVYEIV